MMGKRNLAIAGTHVDYFADVFDEAFGEDPSLVAECASPEDAATSYFANIFENSNGLIRSGKVGVWPVAGEVEGREVFEVSANVWASSDAASDELEVELKVARTDD